MNYFNLASRKKRWSVTCYAIATILLLAISFANAETAINTPPLDLTKNIRVTMVTSIGTIEIELYSAKAPITVNNFVQYIDNNFYNNTIFHRVIPGFMIQGGGLGKGMVEKATQPPIKNEAGNGLANLRGTIAMARNQSINSASSQFYINLVDNAYLNHKDDVAANYGYCVFGKVVKGMDVVDKIAKVPTTTVGIYRNVPQSDVVILEVKRSK
ncbi:MAG TPA: peptidylprolyl isomerase A [Firmicutes bacterium]|jgi:peptidyl-prolyl cis-trans isomerase A (cyclophilin A)|nr:peptidylprolyl isomerase A [Bacillota bacterium]